MSYIDTISGEYPISENDIKSSHPNVSFPTIFTPPDRYKFVFPTPIPNYNPAFQRLIEKTPRLTHLGHYEQVWEVI